MAYSVTEVYHGRTWERDSNGITTTVIYTGTKADCDGWAAAQTIGATYAGLGKLASVAVTQDGGAIYNVTARYQNANGTSGGTSLPVTPPDYTFGEFSATLDCTMMSTPLEIHRNASGSYDYRVNWNHYLLGRSAVVPGQTTNPPNIPAWWYTLGANSSTGAIGMIPSADQSSFRLSETGSDLPQEDGYEWFVIATPTMAGYTSYDRCLYTQTEAARFRNRSAAIAAVSSYANKRGTPINNPGSPFVDGRWKCDRATVSWTGDFWLASLTWTYSPDGWNATLYPNQ